MDWQSLVPFIPFFATFFGVLTAFFLQWLGRLYDRRKDRKQFLKDIRFELETGSTYLTGEARTMPTDLWESGKTSGLLSLLPYEKKTKLASIYHGINSHNYESVRLRDVSILAATTTEKPKVDAVIQIRGEKTAKILTSLTPAQLLHHALTARMVEDEKALKKAIEDLLKENIWK